MKAAQRQDRVWIRADEAGQRMKDRVIVERRLGRRRCEKRWAQNVLGR